MCGVSNIHNLLSYVEVIVPALYESAYFSVRIRRHCIMLRGFSLHRKVRQLWAAKVGTQGVPSSFAPYRACAKFWARASTREQRLCTNAVIVKSPISSSHETSCGEMRSIRTASDGILLLLQRSKTCLTVSGIFSNAPGGSGGEHSANNSSRAFPKLYTVKEAGRGYLVSR
jgi:hypothetical protein